MLLTECFWIKRLAPTAARQCLQGPGQGAIYNTISHTHRGYRHQNCSRLIILNGYREGATLWTAFSLALNQEGRGREGWAKCTAQANGKSKIIVFAFFIIQHECIDGERERGFEGEWGDAEREKKHCSWLWKNSFSSLAETHACGEVTAHWLLLTRRLMAQ